MAVEVLLAPELGSPKFHEYVTPPEEVLVKFTGVLTHCSVGEEVKEAVGTGCSAT